MRSLLLVTKHGRACMSMCLAGTQLRFLTMITWWQHEVNFPKYMRCLCFFFFSIACVHTKKPPLKRDKSVVTLSQECDTKRDISKWCFVLCWHVLLLLLRQKCYLLHTASTRFVNIFPLWKNSLWTLWKRGRAHRLRLCPCIGCENFTHSLPKWPEGTYPFLRVNMSPWRSKIKGTWASAPPETVPMHCLLEFHSLTAEMTGRDAQSNAYGIWHFLVLTHMQTRVIAFIYPEADKSSSYTVLSNAEFSLAFPIWAFVYFNMSATFSTRHNYLRSRFRSRFRLPHLARAWSLERN